MSGDPVARWFELGAARLPTRPVTRAELAARVATIVDEGVAITDIDDAGGADLYVACALAKRDPEALAYAERELVPAARHAAARIDGDRAFVDEVVQRVRDRLFVGESPAIASYRGTGPLARWVRVTATRIAVDLKRGDARHGDAHDVLEQLPAPDDPELALIWESCAEIYKAALAAAFAELTARERTLLRQRYLDGLDIDALGKLHRVHPSTAFRWIRQIEDQLAETTRAAVIAKLALSESQLRSMERLIASRLQLSLPRMLRGGRRS
ncbi:MAG TPA: hypothetical protein VFQ53_13445 [Kofleriaceae bacterium]|nr:hypothetical protein [Kofleriaceae bacterium]